MTSTPRPASRTTSGCEAAVSERFTLDADPAELALAEQKLTWLAHHLQSQGTRLRSLDGDREGWAGVAADSTFAEMGVIAGVMTTHDDRLTGAVHAVATFRTAVEEAQDSDLPRLNKQWDAAQAEHRHAVSSARRTHDEATGHRISQEDRADAGRALSTAVGAADDELERAMRALEARFQTLRESLQAAARTCAAALLDARPIRFTAEQWDRIRHGDLNLGDLTALRQQVFGQTSVLHLSDVARTAEDVLARIKGGADPADVLDGLPPATLDELVQRGLLDGATVAAGLGGRAEVKALLDRLRDAEGDYGWNGNTDDLRDVLHGIQGLSPAEREAFLSSLDDDQLDAFRSAITDSGTFRDFGLPHWEQQDLETALLSTVSPASVARLVERWKLNPALLDGMTWGTPTSPLTRGDETVTDTGELQTGGHGNTTRHGTSPLDWTDINQGGVGDCWFLATLAALGHDRGPSAYDGMVTPNLNGTVSVRLYDDDGHAHLVTVDKQLPFDSANPDVLKGAAGDHAFQPDQETWPAYIEKALAHSYEHGGDPNSYKAIEGDTSDRAAHALTGRGTHDVDDGGWGPFGGSTEERVDNMRKALEEGRSVFVSTKGGDDDHLLLDKRVVAGHLYFVRRVLPDGRVEIGNPWGVDATPSSAILTAHELDEISSGVSATDGP